MNAHAPKVEKRGLNVRGEVFHPRLVDPRKGTPEAFAQRDGAWVLIAPPGEDDEVHMPPFEALTFPLSTLWPA